ncbi:MAG: HAMP domain-containing sensor histidine kinase [Pseudomonadota bacterium]
MSSSRYAWLLPLLAVSVAAVAGGVALRQMDRSLDQLELGFAQHANSVARLVVEGTRQATTALDLVMDLGEQQLVHAVGRLAGASDHATRATVAKEEDLVAWWSAADAGGDPGVLDAVRFAAVRAQVLKAPPGVLVDDGAVAAASLYCSRALDDDRRVLGCRSLQELQDLRRETGMARLLNSVVGDGVRYVVLQDQEGILASSRQPPALLGWSEDAALDAALHGRQLQLRHQPGESPVLEGLMPFTLPDDSRALLRIGIDATPLVQARAHLARQQRVLLAVLVGLVFLALGVTALLERRERARRRQELALQAREDQARHWQVLGEMAATVAHELRNPLNTLGMVGQRLRREFEVPAAERAEFEQLLGVLQGESERVNRVVSEFLELGKPLTLERRQVPLRALLDEVLAPLLLRAQVEDKRLAVDLGADGSVVLDTQRLGQILTNLVGNALDAVPAHGEVKLRAVLADGTLSLHIEDNGPGMDGETLARVQQPFVTTKARGTGLGLPIVRRLVEAHGGDLQLRSSAGDGTTVEVRIPATTRLP